MSRLDIAIDALVEIIRSYFGINLGPTPVRDIKNFIQDAMPGLDTQSEIRFCELFWAAARIAINRILESVGRTTLDEDGEPMNHLFLLWRYEFRTRMQ